jgi:uncharacterized protein YbjT (DUF2867 family)
MTMSIYAVTGASGHIGRFAIQQLLARGVPASDIVAVVRTRGNAAGLAAVGVQVREADYSRPETLGAALAPRLRCSTTRAGTGPASSAAQPSTYPNSPWPSARSPARR